MSDRDRSREPQPRPRKRASRAPEPRRRSNSSPDARSGGARRSPKQRTARQATADSAQRRVPGTARATGRPPARKARPSKARKPSSRRRRVVRYALITLALLFVIGIVTGGVVYASIARDLPDPSQPLKGRDQTSIIYDRDGAVLTELFAEQNRTDVSLDQVPAALRQGVIATEDQRFYEHEGVDPLGIMRALWVDITEGKRHGGSTITQQFVKNAIVTDEQTLKRKLMEAMLAYRLEKDYTKDQILELYLNTIYYGHGAYGVQAASQAYFGKDVQELTVAESAVIAGVIKSPGNYSPIIDPEAGRQRRDTVLAQMRELGFIDQATYDEAVASEITLAQAEPSDTKAPYFVEWVKQTLIDTYGPDAVYKGGLRVTTTIDLGMQAAAEEAITAALDREDDPSASIVAIDPATGQVLAMVGGRDFSTQQFNVAVQGHRQPGSAFKPFVLATALEEGIPSEKAYESAPARLTIPGGQVWKVTGSSGGGLMRLRVATEKSINSVFAQLILEVGAEKVVDMAKRLGITTDVTAVPAIALGGLERGVSPLEMASAYGTFANAGTHMPAHGILRVTEADGTVLDEAAYEGEEAISPAVAYLTTDLLKGVISRGTGKAAKIGRPAAGKTGTTQEYRDAWFVGYTPHLSAAVWVGHPEGQLEMKDVHGRKVTGGSFPAEIWAAFMKKASEAYPSSDFERPKGLTTAKVCSETGLAATDFCPETVSALLLSGTTLDECALHAEPEVIDIPNLIGKTKEEALALLKQLMLLFRVEEREMAGVPIGIVGDQDPRYPSQGTTQTVVTLYVSKGTPKTEPPTALFTYTPTAPAAGEVVRFDASTSTDDGVIVKYAWEFGDGSPLIEGKTVDHTFTAAGTYTVTLWVTDDTDQVASLPVSVEVR